MKTTMYKYRHVYITCTQKLLVNRPQTPFFFETWFSQNRLSSKISLRANNLESAKKLLRQNPLSLADLALLRCHRARVSQKAGP